jgi:hypothetical protein
MQETFMDKVTSINSEVIGPEATRSKLSLNKETLQQLKVRTGIKAGIATPTHACKQPTVSYIPTTLCSMNRM